MLEGIIEVKKILVPDNRRHQEGSGQRIYSTISSVITMELKDGDLFKTFQQFRNMRAFELRDEVQFKGERL